MTRKEKIKAILDAEPGRSEELLNTLSDVALDQMILINRMMIARQLNEACFELA
ncbi:hypothetical protein NE293_04810 [Latilactobacillus curvatus]|uniref:hypothetical protein n=1 Tax=Latilactobacillus curvatus TaxID=28038 RepID=UPI002073659E|nr:hypothetical protein [Latilactobacillus curvatus]MCM6843996.1 hypothetical protein [Latilactobacillus curvatus]MCM6861117.1 hypothetical protein [Latilactobacillus curvatus]MCM6868415.1 hypothetical protein [Latilactobacillus curvatus]